LTLQHWLLLPGPLYLYQPLVQLQPQLGHPQSPEQHSQPRLLARLLLLLLRPPAVRLEPSLLRCCAVSRLLLRLTLCCC
jgi:hypothetical protein